MRLWFLFHYMLKQSLVSSGVLQHSQAMWMRFNDIFGTINEYNALQIEEKLTLLLPNYFPSIKDFLQRFKPLRSLLQGCEKNKIDKECIFLILFKLQGSFQVFSSNFYSTMDALGDAFTMPTFEVFCERLTHEQKKLVWFFLK